MSSNIQLEQGKALLKMRQYKIKTICNNVKQIKGLSDSLVTCNTNDCKPQYGYCPQRQDHPTINTLHNLLSKWGNSYKGFIEDNNSFLRK